MSRTVWAFRPLPELNNQTGFVECGDDELAERLLRADLVQDPQIGLLLMRERTTVPPAKPEAPPPLEYDTKVMRPKPPASRK
jgi:hypothetical protein